MCMCRYRFDSNVVELRATQEKKVRMFSDAEYFQYAEKVKDIRIPLHRMVPTDLYLMERFEVMQVRKIKGV